MKLLKSLTWLFIIMMAFGVVGCTDDDDDDPIGPTTTDMLNDMAAVGADYFGNGTKNITSALVYTDMQDGTELFIIDYRSADHFAASHIDVDALETANATIVNWAVADLMDNLDLIPATAKIVNVCYSGQTASQATAALRLLDKEAWNLKFGMCGWTTDEAVNLGKWTTNLNRTDVILETESNGLSTFDLLTVDLDVADVDAAFITKLDEYFTAGTNNISATDLMANLNDGDTTNDPYIVNYWPAAKYDIGHIPSAVNFDTAIASFKALDAAALASLPTDRQIVFYCWTGQTSSQACAYLNALGYDAYSLLYGINSILEEDVVHNDFDGVYYHAPDTDYPVTQG
jgi:rhodanese-related sulfurtransferase